MDSYQIKAIHESAAGQRLAQRQALPGSVYEIVTDNRAVPEVVPLVITGSLVASIPMVVSFLALQHYWRAGATAGAIKG
jgi:ABC-type maltose transport system permease subunit